MSNIILEKIYQRVSEKTGQPYEVVEKVCRSEVEFITKVIASGELKSVRLKYLGIIGVKTRRLKYLNDKEREKREKEIEDSNGHRSEG